MKYTVYPEFALQKTGLIVTESELPSAIEVCMKLSPTGRVLVCDGVCVPPLRDWEDEEPSIGPI